MAKEIFTYLGYVEGDVYDFLRFLKYHFAS